MDSERSLNFYKLLHEIEHKIGNRFYNGHIQNWGPFGDYEGEGREFRYPVTWLDPEGNKQKYYERFPPIGVLGEKQYRSAHYSCGANGLFILEGIRNALEMLEERFDINFDQLLEHEKSRSDEP